MELNKAIELNTESERSLRKHKFYDYADAVKMGNEALKAVEDYRKKHPERAIALLPGED